MTIKTSEIKEFLQASRYINNSRKILQVLDYILWSGNTLTKSNMHSFCVMQIESVADEPVLIDLASLDAALIDAKDEIEVNFNKDKNEISLKSGKTPIKFTTDAAVNFPAIPEQTGDHIPLTADVVGHIKYASMFTSKEDNGEKMRHVHIFNGLLFATNNFIFYAANIPESIPSFIVSDDALPIVSNLYECEYVSGERNDFYTAGNVTYIFIKTEHKSPGEFVKNMHKEWKDAPQNFILQKSELSSYIKKVMRINADQNPYITMHQNGEGIDISFSGQNAKSIDTKLWSSGNMEHDFTFNPKHTAQMIEYYPSEVINCKQIYNKLSKGIMLVFENESNGAITTIQNLMS